MSRQFVGNQNIVYKKLKKLTNIPSEVELRQEIDERIGTLPQPNTERGVKAAATARRSSMAARDGNLSALAPEASRREMPSVGRSASAVNIRQEFAKKTPMKSRSIVVPPPKQQSTPKTARPKSRITNI